jgi:hypothetical protein
VVEAGEDENTSLILHDAMNILMQEGFYSTRLILEQQLAYPLATIRPQ